MRDDLADIDPGQRDEVLAAMMEADSANSEEFVVFQENWETVKLFMLLPTQWNVGGMGGLIGLRYEAVEAVMRMSLIPKNKQLSLLRNLQIMEYTIICEKKG